MARVYQKSPHGRAIAVGTAGANGTGRGFVAYTAFTLSLGFAAAVVLGLVH